MDELHRDPSITFMNPFLPIYDKKRLGERLYEELSVKFPDLTFKEVGDAVDAGCGSSACGRGLP